MVITLGSRLRTAVTLLALLALAILYQGWIVFSIFRYKNSNPSSTALTIRAFASTSPPRK